MGCDIHWVVEVKNRNRWIGLMCSTYSEVPASNRWYSFFAEFGVRGESITAIPPRGLPDDLSDLAKHEIESGSWDHSQSHVSLAEFVEAYVRASNRCELREVDNLFGERGDFFQDHGEPEFRVVLAFDS